MSDFEGKWRKVGSSHKKKSGSDRGNGRSGGQTQHGQRSTRRSTTTTTQSQKNKVQENVRWLLKDYSSGDIDLRELTGDFLKLVNEEPALQAKAQYFSVMAGYWFHEVLCDEDVMTIFKSRDIHEGDGYDPFSWANWSFYVSNPIEGFERTLDDAVKTIRTISSAGYSPLERNKKGENSFDSLRMAVTYNAIDQSFLGPMMKAYAYPSPDAGTRIIGSIMTKITPGTADKVGHKQMEITKKGSDGTPTKVNVKVPYTNYRTVICWMFKLFPDRVAKTLVTQCCLLSVSMKDKTGFWKAVADIVDLYRNLLFQGPNTKSDEFKYIKNVFGGKWDSAAEVARFNEKIASEVISRDPSSFNETQFPDPLAAIVGESGVISLQEEYVTICIARKQYDLALYCLRHASKAVPLPVIESKILGVQSSMNTRQTFMMLELFNYRYGKEFSSVSEITRIIGGSVESDSSDLSESSDESQSDISDVNECKQYNTDHLRNLDYLFAMKSFETVEPTTDGAIKNIAEDIEHHFEKIKGKLSKETFLENIIIKTIDVISRDAVLNGFIELLQFTITKGIFSQSDLSAVLKKLTPLVPILRDDYDSPIWAGKIIGACSNLLVTLEKQRKTAKLVVLKRT